MDARVTRNLLVIAAVVLAGVAILPRISKLGRLSAPARASVGTEESPPGSADPARADGVRDASARTVSGSRGASTPPAPLALPAVPNGDFEITVTDSELQAIVDARYGPLLRSLAFSSDVKSRLREFLVERQHAAIDVANAAMVAGLNPIRDLELIRRAITLAEQDVDADLGRELGPTVVLALHEFERGRAEQNTIDDLTLALAGTGEPLRPAQQRRLRRILEQTAAAGVAPDINGAIYGRYDRRAEVSSRAIDAA